MSLNYTISVADSNDHLAIATLHALVFSDDLATKILFPKDPYLEAQIRWSLELFQRAKDEPDFHCIKATENATGKIVGAAMLQCKPPITDPTKFGPFPMIQNQEFFKAFFPQSRSIMQKRFGDKRPAGWYSLVVHPDYQRLGVGTALLRYGLNDLEMRKEALFVNAMFPVQKLYAKFGWDVIGEIQEDLSKWAGECVGYGLYKTVIMAREPSDEV